MPCCNWLNIESSSCLRSSSISSSNCSRASSSIPVVLLELAHPAREVGRQLVELLSPLAARALRAISSRRLSPDCRASSSRRSMPSRSCSTISSSSLGDLLVHAAEVVAVELLAALLPQLLEHLAHALDVAALAVVEALLHHAAQRGVQIAVVEQVVGHLLEQRVGVEVEADLRAVPPRVLEPAHAAVRRLPVARSERRTGTAAHRGLSRRVLVGHRRVVDAGRRRRAGVRLVRVGAGRARAAVG